MYRLTEHNGAGTLSTHPSADDALTAGNTHRGHDVDWLMRADGGWRENTHPWAPMLVVSETKK